MIESGTLTERIQFMSADITRDDYGGQVTSWNPTYACWAKVTYNKGARAITMGEIWLPNTISVLIRYTDKVDERQRMIWNNKTYRIDSLNSSKRDGSATIVATRVDEGTGKE